MVQANTIDIKIATKEQLFSEFNYSDDKLDTELGEYLFDKAQHLPTEHHHKQPLTIKIHTSDNTFEVAEAAQCIHHHYHLAYADSKKELWHWLNFALIMFGSGIIAFVLQFFTQKWLDNFFVNAILNVAAWVFTWEAVDVLFLRSHAIRQQITVQRRLAYALIQICPNE